MVKPGGHRQVDGGHLRQVGTLAAKQVAHVRAPLVMARAEAVHPLGHVLFNPRYGRSRPRGPSWCADGLAEPGGCVEDSGCGVVHGDAGQRTRPTDGRNVPSAGIISFSRALSDSTPRRVGSNAPVDLSRSAPQEFASSSRTGKESADSGASGVRPIFGVLNPQDVAMRVCALQAGWSRLRSGAAHVLGWKVSSILARGQVRRSRRIPRPARRCRVPSLLQQHTGAVTALKASHYLRPRFSAD